MGHGSWVGQEHYCSLPTEELYVRLSPHTAQVINKHRFVFIAGFQLFGVHLSITDIIYNDHVWVGEVSTIGETSSQTDSPVLEDFQWFLAEWTFSILQSYNTINRSLATLVLFHLIGVPLLEIAVLFLVEWIGILPDFDVSLYCNITHMDQPITFFNTIQLLFQTAKTVISQPFILEIPIDDPFCGLLRMSPFTPSPYYFPDLMIYLRKDCFGHYWSMVICPAPDLRINDLYQRNLVYTSVFTYCLSDFSKESFNVWSC